MNLKVIAFDADDTLFVMKLIFWKQKRNSVI